MSSMNHSPNKKDEELERNAFHDLGHTPDRHNALARDIAGEELPIFQDIARCGIGDVIRGQGKALQAQPRHAGRQRAGGVALQLG